MYQELKHIIENGERIVFFGGAGVSTESGIPDFRSETGLYTAQREYGYSPEYLLSEEFFLRKPEIFFDYYKKNLLAYNPKPNRAHIALAKMEEEGKLIGIVTQNIDGLHQRAGSKNVYELHGSMQTNTCVHCGEIYTISYILDESNCKSRVPKCSKCGHTIKPDIVLYGGMLDEACIEAAVDKIAKADVLIVAGTSLVVYPAAGFLRYFNGSKLVLINKTETSIDHQADLVIHDSVGEVLGTCLNVK